ncbi:acyltransferase [Thomasclavelia cocleata]|jgi:maltose O-acetyltransferase|uniref:acyltransferase n=1 Tax=Thomasclavelia cocleata TaxID=69824 RepID=UPI00241D2754|nr:acyltransferase [Thomasclavelia cocleata]
MNKIRKLIYLFFINKFLSTTRFFKLKSYLLNSCGIKVGKNTKIVGPLFIGSQVDLIIGDNCWIGKNLHIEGNGKVIIGECCDIAPDVMIITGSHEIGDKFRRAGKGTMFKVVIKNGCWIGSRATIFGNVSISEGSVIGAASLVNKDIEKNVIVAGVPAKIIHKLDGGDS